VAYESQVTFTRPQGRVQRLLQSLGWRAWQVDFRVGARGGSYHLEVASPPGVDIIGISADPSWTDPESEIDQSSTRTRATLEEPTPSHRTLKERLRSFVCWTPDAAISVPGYLPHVHIGPPNAAYLRYRAAVFIRVSRPGWLTASWLVAVVIGVVIGVGRFNLDAVYGRGESGQAATAATLLLALLGVFATLLVRPSAHPLASRLLLLARVLILTDVMVVLTAVGNLVLHLSKHPMPVGLWTWLALVAAAVTVLMTVSRIFPVAIISGGSV
jgi:hypothetical protein